MGATELANRSSALRSLETSLDRLGAGAAMIMTRHGFRAAAKAYRFACGFIYDFVQQVVSITAVASSSRWLQTQLFVSVFVRNGVLGQRSLLQERIRCTGDHA